jgi:hypothetical protein
MGAAGGAIGFTSAAHSPPTDQANSPPSPIHAIINREIFIAASLRKFSTTDSNMASFRFSKANMPLGLLLIKHHYCG